MPRKISKAKEGKVRVAQLSLATGEFNIYRGENIINCQSAFKNCMPNDFVVQSGTKGLRAMVPDQPNRVGRRLSAILAADVAAHAR
jgi:hypothetical protein